MVHLPLVLKLWFGKLFVDYVTAAYLSLEKSLVGRLADVEAGIVEPNLPVTVTMDAEGAEEPEVENL